MTKQKLIPVKFVKQWQAYNANDVAGFPEGMAIKLIRMKVAVSPSPPPAAKAEAPPKRKPVKRKKKASGG